MTITMKGISLTLAETAANAAIAKAIELNLKIAVAIMDAHGNLKFYQRMDGNNAVSVEMSQRKAKTSAYMPISTKEFAKRNQHYQGAYLGIPDLVTLEGGLPIITQDGEHIGSIGISGATPELDGLCAQAGIDAIENFL